MGISRGAYYYQPCPESQKNLALMRLLDQLHLEHPVYGSLGIEAIYPRRKMSGPGEAHEIYPYLLKGLEISGPNQVWCSDITYVPMA